MSTERRELTDTICIVGLGYVGLPLAVAFDRAGYTVVGYDVDEAKVEAFRSGRDPTSELSNEEITASSIEFTADPAPIERAEYVIVGVPTPIDEMQSPDLEYVADAGRTVGQHISEGTTVILESTVYPGATREILVPAIEETSGLTGGTDFSYGYSPERMVPGDNDRGLSNVVKIVSGHDEETRDDIAALYGSIVDAGIHRAPEIEVAEASKCIENAQRDLNIALMNELAVACHAIGIDTQDVLEAARTKWNFHDYSPGLVGGHCIPVDPFYIIYESERNGFSPKLMQQSREVNEYMPQHVAKITIQGLNECGKVLRESTVLILGAAYKPGVGDTRTSQIDGVIDQLRDYSISVEGYDPLASNDTMRDQFDIETQDELTFDGVDGIVLATPHDELVTLDYASAADAMADDPLLVDVKGALDRSSVIDYGFEYRRL